MDFESETQILLSRDLDYIESAKLEEIIEEIQEVDWEKNQHFKKKGAIEKEGNAGEGIKDGSEKSIKRGQVL